MSPILIPLNSGRCAIISPEDEELIMRAGRWSSARYGEGVYYATRRVRSKCPETGRPKLGTLYMHRLVIGAAAGQFVDHINGDGLDNRRENLRIATRSQNAANMRNRTRKGGYRGVENVGPGKWRAVLMHDRRRYSGGVFASPIDAARKYDEMAKSLFGEFARPNFEVEVG